MAKWPKEVPVTAMPPIRPRRLLNQRETVDDTTPMVIPETPTAVTTP